MNAYGKLKALNARCRNILNIVQKNGPMTKNEIIKITGIKLTTLNRDIQILCDNRMIVETSVAESTGGRKPVLYDVNPYDYYSIGIDISRTYTQIVITNLKMKIAGQRLIDNSYSMKNITSRIGFYIDELMKKSNINKKMIACIGIGIVSGFKIDILENELSQKFGVPIYSDNGANTAAMGEYFFGLGKGSKSMVYINCGVGIRTGVIYYGKLIRTINNSEDAFAHMIVNAGGETCSCGNDGCIESYASILKITKRFNDIIKDKPEGKNRISYIDICRKAEDKDPISIDVITEASMYFGIGLSNYIRLFNPSVVILNGPLIKHSKLFYSECINTAIEKSHIDKKNIVFNRGGYFQNKSIAVGASVMALERLIYI